MKLENPNSILTVDLAAVKKNLKVLKRRSISGRVMAVVKVNAYNHGAVSCSRYLEPDLDAFAVATVDEAVELREAGIGKEILVFGVPDKDTAGICLNRKITVTVSHRDHFQILKEGMKYHLNFDTGMRRLGFNPSEAEEVLELMSSHPDLSCRGIYSHYANADDPGDESVIRQNRAFEKIRGQFGGLPAHMSNTGAVMHYDVNHFDMVRAGLGLFGYTPGRHQPKELQPVLTWESRIVQVRKIRKGDSVSYGGNWNSPEDGYLGTIPVGYADGIPRSLSNKLEVALEGRRYPVVGNITMDSCMVYFGKRQIRQGTEVELLGGSALTVADWAERAGSIPHEILCRLNGRMTRSYRFS
ncbi:MAG: alanine racemase [Balneolaceae bacterium]